VPANGVHAETAALDDFGLKSCAHYQLLPTATEAAIANGSDS
jgi:hypothetical protein